MTAFEKWTETLKRGGMALPEELFTDCSAESPHKQRTDLTTLITVFPFDSVSKADLVVYEQSNIYRGRNVPFTNSFTQTTQKQVERCNMNTLKLGGLRYILLKIAPKYCIFLQYVHL